MYIGEKRTPVLETKKKLKCFLSKGSKCATQVKAIKSMSATIMMPQAIDQCIREMCSDAMSQVVAALSEKYGFDADEASRFIELDDVKVVRKRGPSPKKSDEKPIAKSKKATKSKKDDDTPKKKRDPTGYLLYSKEMRADVKEELLSKLEEGEKLMPQDVVKALAARWKNLDEMEKNEWNSKAKTPVVSDEE